MKSFDRLLKKLTMSKRGEVLDLPTGIIISILSLILIAFVALFAVSTLNPSGFFTAGTAEANVTTQAVANYTQGIGSFFQYIPTIFKVVAVVVILGVLGLLMYMIYRWKSAGMSGNSGL